MEEFFIILLFKGIWKMIKACFLLNWNIFAFLYNNYVVKKTIRLVEKENMLNRDIIEYREKVDHVFPTGLNNNILISGGEKSLRTELLISGIRNSSNPTIIIHNSNTMLSNSFFGLNTVVISTGSKNYDPFYLRSDDEILDMIIDSAPEKYHLEYNAVDYIEGMLMFLRSKHIRPTLHRLATCPHPKLVGNINSQISKGQIDGKLGREIIMKLNAGQSEQSKINRYFRDLEKECGKNLFDTNIGNCIDIEEAISNGKNIIIDIGGTLCPLFLDLICCQFRNLKRIRPSISIIFDDVPINTNDDIVREMFEKTMNGLVVSCEDINSLFQNDENLFNTFYSNCYSRVILQQKNGISAKRFSGQIGTYRHKEVKKSISETVFQLSNAIPFGVPIHHIIDEKDEPKVSEYEMQNLLKDNAYYYEYSQGKWIKLIIE